MRFAVDTELLLLWYIGSPLVIAVMLGWLVLVRRRASTRAVADPALYGRIAPATAESVHRARVCLAVLVVLALGLAAGRPQTGTRLGVATRHGIDLMLALDVSDSMRAEDLRPDRLEKARREALTLIELLDGDRVGVITFAGAAFVQCPLTLDYGAASMLLSAVEPGTISRPGTDLGAAIRKATAALTTRPDRSKALVIFTDGEGHEEDPIEAAREAAEAGVRIYTIGLGSTAGEPIPLSASEGGGYKRDRSGNIVMSRLDEGTLMDIASVTGGSYYRATSGERELRAIEEELARMEQGELESRMLAFYEERFQVPMVVALALVLLATFVPARRPARTSPVLRTLTALALAAVFPLLTGFGETPGGHNRQGNRLYREGRYSEALTEYRSGQVLAPELAALGFNAGNALFQSGDVEAALREYQQAASAGDDELAAAALYNAGDALLAAGDLDGAIQAFRQSLLRNPDDLDAKYNLEVAQLAREQQEQQQQEQQQGGEGEQGEDEQDRQDGEQQEQDQGNQGDQGDQQQDGEQREQDQDEQQGEDQQSEGQDEGPEQQDGEQQDGEQQDGEQQDGEQQPGEDGGTPGEMDAAAMTPEEAERLLDAIEQGERELQAELLSAKARKRDKVDKDW